MTSRPGLVAGTTGVVSAVVALGAGYLIVRRPFLGGPTLAPRPLPATLGAFIVGVVLMAWGITQSVRL